MSLLDQIKEALQKDKYVPVETGTGEIIIVARISNDPDFPLVTPSGEEYTYEDWGYIVDLKTGEPVLG